MHNTEKRISNLAKEVGVCESVESDVGQLLKTSAVIDKGGSGRIRTVTKRETQQGGVIGCFEECDFTIQ